MLKNISVHEIPSNLQKEGKVQKEVKKFLKSDNQAAEIVGFNGRSTSAATTYRNAVKRMKAPCKIIVRKNRIFIVREGV